MAHFSLPFDKTFIEQVTKTYPTPFHIYDEEGIRKNARHYLGAFSWVPAGKPADGSAPPASGGFKITDGFTNYFAVKALPNPHILKIVKDEGMGVDCSSLPELVMAEKCGFTGEEIMFSANDTPAVEFRKARELGAVINLDDISHLSYLERETDGLPQLLCLRYNPGSLKGGNSIIGIPTDAKYGFTREQAIEGYRIARGRGVKRFGLHTMVASNELNSDYFIETADILFDLALEVLEKTGVRIEFLNLGGGIGIPYNVDDEPVDLPYVSEGIRGLYDKKIAPSGLHPLPIVMENGRVVTGPYGFLVARVLHIKETYKKFIGLDANMAHLMRPAIYGAYHHITVLGKEDAQASEVYDVTGSLCENNDKFAVDRPLPKVEVGDVLVIHNTGAHGHAMGFNYNGKLRSAELLLEPDSSVRMIRRAETIEDYFATLDFSGV